MVIQIYSCQLIAAFGREPVRIVAEMGLLWLYDFWIFKRFETQIWLVDLHWVDEA